MYIELFESRFRSVSPAPPSNNTLSGNTTAARPLMSRIVLMCWTKFNCLFIVTRSRPGRSPTFADSLPSSPTTSLMTLCRTVGLRGKPTNGDRGQRSRRHGLRSGCPRSGPIPWRIMFIAARQRCHQRVPHRAQSCPAGALSASESDRQRVGLHARMRRARTLRYRRQGQRQCRQWWAVHSRPLLRSMGGA